MVITDNIIDLNKYGNVIGNVRYGNAVQFFCRANDGGETDVRTLTLLFATDEVAANVAAACGPIANAESLAKANAGAIALDVV